MSEFERSIDSKVKSASQSKAAKSNIVTGAVDATRALLTISEGLPYVGPVAQLLNTAISICDQHKCNKEAFEQLKTRLCHFSQLFFDKGGLAEIARDRTKNELLTTYAKRMEDTLNEAIVQLGSFAKAGFFSSLLLGSKPKQQFDQLDADLTQCLNELSVVLQTVQLNEQAQTYQVVCDIQSKIDSNGGLHGVNNDPALLQALADEIGADVEDLKVEVKDSLDRIEATVNQVDENVKITQSKVDEIGRDVQIIMGVLSSHSGKITSADQATISLTSTPVIDYSKVLGQGTFGTVYDGRYNNELVAVKVISAAAGLTAAQLNELSREVLMHSKVCNLPGVVRLYGANLTVEPRCVVLELADGSLHDVLHKNRPSIDLSMTSKLSLAVQVSSAMACISDMGVVHRDIKSSNVLIFLQSQGRVSAKLADFGLAKLNSENTFATSQTPKGTPPYMAPEVFKGKYSSASDVYAFAVMLNEMLLREVPFPSVTVHEIMMKVTHKARPNAFTTTPSDRVGCRLMSLISSCWNQDPQLRMTFQALASEISQLLAAAVEIARNGTVNSGLNLSTSFKDEPTTPLSLQSPESAINTLAEWLTNSCGLLYCDSTSLAHTLVTTKCITSVAALSEVLHIRPDLLTQELKIAEAYDLHVRKALNQMKNNQMKKEKQLVNLTVEEVGLLLENQNLHLIKPIFEENVVSGTILENGFESVEDLKEIGIKPLQAKTLFKLINEWKEHGLPTTFLDELGTPSTPSTTPTATLTTSGAPAISTAGNIYIPTEISTATTTPTTPTVTATGCTVDTSIPTDIISDATPPTTPSTGSTTNDFIPSDVVTAATTNVSSETKPNLETPKAAAEEKSEANVDGAEKTAAPEDTAALFEKKYTAARFCGDTSACLFLLDKAENGSPLAMAYLGILYYTGCSGLVQDAGKSRVYTKRALTWLQAEVAGSNKYAQFLLGTCYEEGRGVTKDEAEAVRLYKLAAEQGHTGAQYSLGVCYMNGAGVTKDEAKAAGLYKLAADQGYAPAQFSLGLCYEDGTGVSKNKTEAAMLYNLAEAQGMVKPTAAAATNGSAKIPASEQSPKAAAVEKAAPDSTGKTAAPEDTAALFEKKYTAARFCGDTSACLFLLDKAENGSHQAEAYLGILYYTGCNGLAKDARKAHVYTKKALSWLQAEVAGGNKYAQFLLGTCYYDGRGVAKNESEAAKLFQQAAEHGHVGALYSLGMCFEKGTEETEDELKDMLISQFLSQNRMGQRCTKRAGVAQNTASAARLYGMAAKQQHAGAQFSLGMCLEKGIGVKKDIAEAVRLYKLAADQGNAEAQCSLGLCYWNGSGVDKDVAKAVRLYKSSADQGHSKGQHWLAFCCANGTGVAKNDTEAARLFKLAAEQGNVDSVCSLAICLKKGTGIVKNEAEAARLFKMAAHKGHPAAQYHLGIGVPRNHREARRYLELAARKDYAGAAEILSHLNRQSAFYF